MFKKGQAAMEFLMTYGWAILVVLAAIGALAYFGVLSPDNLLLERTSFLMPIPNLDTSKISVNGSNLEIEIAFSNSLGRPINVTTLNPSIQSLVIDGTSYACATGITGLPTVTTGSVDAIANAQTFTYKWTCDDAVADFSTLNIQNKRVKADLSFEYINKYSGQTKVASGNVNGKVSSEISSSSSSVGLKN